jgi:hypothetical protein
MPGDEKKKKKRIKHRLPKKILPIKCADKEGWYERWKPGRDPLNIIHPFRMVLLGPPGSGKTCSLKNVVIRCKPAFERIICVHCAPDSTREYEDIDAEMVGEIPQPEEFDGEEKTFVILDDVDLTAMDKIQKGALDRLFGYVSTHCNVSVCLTSQEAFGIPPIVRRCSNFYVIWRISDADSLKAIGRKVGFKSADFQHIFDKYLREPKSSLWIDLTEHSPFPLRLNGYELLERKDES